MGAPPGEFRDMKKTIAAFVAVATIAGSLAANAGKRQRGVCRRRGGRPDRRRDRWRAIASSRPAYGGRSMSRKPRPRPAVWFASASGMATSGATAALSLQ
jgi:Ni/Co efflux regulator RcnB